MKHGSENSASFNDYSYMFFRYESPTLTTIFLYFFHGYE